MQFHQACQLAYIGIYISTICAADKLLGSYIITRHGERSPYPLVAYPTYDLNASQWKNGVGSLTDRGISQSYNLGSYMNKRYSIIMGKNISDRNIVISSSNASMTISSAMAFFNGFNHTIYNDFLKQKILNRQDIDSLGISIEDDLLLVSLKKCFNHVTELNKHLYMTNNSYKSFVQENAQLFSRIYNITGIYHKAPLHIISVADTVLCHRMNNIPLPDNITEGMYAATQEVCDRIFADMFKHNQRSRLECNRLLGEKIILSIKKKVRRDKSTLIRNGEEINIGRNVNGPIGMRGFNGKLIRLYSAHDITIVGLMSLFGIDLDHRPPPASAFIIDLWRNSQVKPCNTNCTLRSENKSRKHVLKFYYMIGSNNNEPHIMVKGLTDFKTIERNLLPLLNETTECDPYINTRH